VAQPDEGLPGVEASAWNAYFLPKGTPDAIVRRLNKAANETLDNPLMRKRLEELGPRNRSAGTPYA
jgi:putative tricarboxylic transport membrane protein